MDCFGFLRAWYTCKVEQLKRCQIHRITVLEFIPALTAAFDSAFTAANIESGFRTAGLVPFNPQRVLDQTQLIESGSDGC